MEASFMVPINEFVYTGQTSDGLPSGYGQAFSYKEGHLFATYNGYWYKGLPFTYGKLITSENGLYQGSYYKGLWANGTTFGPNGEYKYPRGDAIFKGTN